VQLFDLLTQLLLADRLDEVIGASVNTVGYTMVGLKAREAADVSRTQATKSCLKTLVASVGFHHSWYLFKFYAFCKRWTQFLELWASYSWVQIFFALAFTSEGKACVFCPFTILTMQKTRKSIAKRFKKTGTGKLLRRTPGHRHLLRTKSVKQRRRAGSSKLVADGQRANLIRGLPFA
jgi:large subunit ribosomal protein L35